MEKFLGDSAIFLLGGRDLEMEEIKKILIAEGFVLGRDLFDHDLDWESAGLEAYSDILEKFPYKTIYAVELNIDEKNDSLYKQHKSHIHIIDHHKADADTPASLLQVLEILDRKPTRDQKLIAANDSGYITEMLCLNASDEEIADIRQRDREAQGIKPLEYQTALQEIANLEDGDGIYKLHTSLEHFSPLADALYFGEKIIVGSKAMIIRNEREICFYGFDGYDLKTIAASFDLDEDDYYYGGRQGGYFCIKKDLLSSKEMDAMVDKAIKKRLDSRTLYSSHILMFPFRFDYVTNDEYVREYDFYEQHSIYERINLKELIARLQGSSDWCYQKFDLKESLDRKETKYYSEYAYFYDYAREALYNMQDVLKKNNEISYYFEHKLFNTGDKRANRWIVDTGERCYELQIEGVSLRIFHTGVAVLAIELDNYDYPYFSDVKAINEYARRFYPQYLSLYEGCIAKPDFLSRSITIWHGDALFVCENFDTEKLVVHHNEITVGKHIMALLGEIFTQDIKARDKYYIQPMLDDRMFVLSWHGNDTIASRLTRDDAYANSDEWYEYVFVDKAGGVTVKNDWMKNDLLYHSTYDRWGGNQTLFGVTRYSFVVLTNTEWFGSNVIRTHLTTMYFQMMLLLLVQRASILRFSDEIAPIADLHNRDDEGRLGDLYARYLSFYNRLYFKEVTHQDQGIELYDMGLKQMKIVEHIDKLDGKFKKLHDFASLKASERENEIAKEESKKMNRLTVLGAIFAVPSVVATIYDLDTLKPYRELAIFLGVVLGGYAAYTLTQGKDNKSTWFKIAIAGLFLFSFVYLCNGCYVDHFKPFLIDRLSSFKMTLKGTLQYLKLI